MFMARTLRRRLERLTYPLGVHRLRSRRANAANPDAVFVWIPKTAGQSVAGLLAEHGCARLKDPWAVRHCFSQRGLVTFGHQSYPALLAAGLVSPAFDQRAYKFCFVRNPYERAVSLFAYLKAKRRLHAQVSFKTFAHLVHDGALEEVGLYNWKGLSQCNSQLAWMQDSRGRTFVDFVGRTETLDEDMAKVCGELGIEGRLPRDNVGDHGFYRDYYDDESRRLVGRAYADDLDQFGYQF
jgi:hypothetical protein